MKFEEIKTAIESLPDNEYIQFRNWFRERDWKIWDKKIRKDSESRKLDFLVNEAFQEKEKGTLKEL